MNRSEIITRFLAEHAVEGMNTLYSPELEVFVDVSTKGERVPIEKGRYYYTDPNDPSGETWAPFRLTSPEDDYPLNFRSDHFSAIGLTGWNYKKQVSQWVGFDFDSVSTHIKGLKDAELLEVQQRVAEVPWVTVRRSTSGKGLHLYVFFADPPETKSGDEHRALARCILGVLSAHLGVRLEYKVDGVGQILWIWNKRQVAGGFSLVKQGSTLELIPHNWKDHIDVIRKKRVWTKAPGDEAIDDLVIKTTSIPMTARHKALLGWFSKHHFEKMWWWDSDSSMLICHTADLKEAHEFLNLRGPFETIAVGSDLGDQNAFLFPLQNGWTVRRHTRGTTEHHLWSTDSGGWTKCKFDAPCDLATASRLHQGAETDKGAFVFQTLLDAFKALHELGIPTPDSLPNPFKLRQTLVTESQKRIIIQLPKDKNDPTWVPGWSPENKKVWQLVLQSQSDSDFEENDAPDDLLRFIVVGKKEAGWFLKTSTGWTSVRDFVVKAYLRGIMAPSDLVQVESKSIHYPWEMVAEPFRGEYPGGRKWNLHAPQLAVEPSPGEHPHWDMIFNHLGANLTEPLKRDKWAMENGVNSGAEYLKLWVACILRKPEDHLPYLFLYSEDQDTGKSMMHEAIKECFLKGGIGCVQADNALMTKFNGELMGAILCVVEETPLNQSLNAYNKIKAYSVGETISIHPKGGTPADFKNYTHWIQCGNSLEECPIKLGDSRITLVRVSGLGERMIPKGIFRTRLREEAPACLWTLMNLTIPEPVSRLAIPVITTPEKVEQMEISTPPVREFFLLKTFDAQGYFIPLADAFEKFMLMPGRVERHWNVRRFAKNLPDFIVRGKDGEQIVIINRSLQAEGTPRPTLTVCEGKVMTVRAAEELAWMEEKKRRQNVSQ